MPEAAEASFRSHLERLTECALCLDTCDDPRRLPCGHSFCLTCLESLWKSNTSASRVKCPHCREDHFIGFKGPANLPKDYIIIQLIDMVGKDVSSTSKQDKSGRCDFCSKTFAKTDKFFYCFDCDCICCMDCCPKHRCNKEQPSILKKMDFVYSMICEKHVHPVRFICQTCNNRLCKKCVRQGECDDHEIFDIFGGIVINDQQPTIAKYTTTTLKVKKKKGSARKSTENAESENTPKSKATPEKKVKPEKSKSTPDKTKTTPQKDKDTPEKPKSTSKWRITPKRSSKKKKNKEEEEDDRKEEEEEEEAVLSPRRSSARSSFSNMSVTSATFRDEPTSPSNRLSTSVIQEEPVVEVVDTLELDANPQPWSAPVETKVKAVTMLPNGFVVALTESSVLTFTNRGNEITPKKKGVKLEDPQHIVYWEFRDCIVVTERMAKRFSLLKKDGTKCYRQIPVKAKRGGIFSCVSGRSSGIVDFGPNHIAVTPSGGFAVTTASTAKDELKPTYEVLIYNNRCKILHRWQCDLAPLSVTCDKDSLLYFPQWHTILVYKLDGTKLYQFGEKKNLFQPFLIAPLSEEHHLLIAHRKSYIGDDYSVWRVSKWRSEQDSESKRKGHIIEFKEGDYGPIADINVHKNLVVLAMEKQIQCAPIEDLVFRPA